MSFTSSVTNGVRGMIGRIGLTGIMERPVMTPVQARTILTTTTRDAYAEEMTRGRWMAFAAGPMGTLLTGLTTAMTSKQLTANASPVIALSFLGPLVLASAAATLLAGVHALRANNVRRDVQHASALLAAMGEQLPNPRVS